MLKQAVLLIDQRRLTDAVRLAWLRWAVQSAVRHGLEDILILGIGDDAGGGILLADAAAASAAADCGEVRLACRSVPAGLGSAGALASARDELHDVFLVLAAERLLDFNWLDLAVGGADEAWLARVASPGGGRAGAAAWLMRRAALDRLLAPTSSLDVLMTALQTQKLLQERRYARPCLEISERTAVDIDDLARRPALFLDRDGVLNVNHGYVHRPDQVEWIPGAIATVKRFNDAGYYVFVVTNQSGVARGYYDEAQVRALHCWMAGEMHAAGAHVDRFEYCPDHPEGSVQAYRRASERRKPGPGMLLDCMARWPVDASRSLLIGDNPSDVAAARAAGIAGHLFEGGDLAAFARSLSSGAPPA